MLGVILDKQILFILMGVFAALGVLSKCIVNVTLKRLVRAAGNMGKSTHPLMRLVRAKFEHACMVNDRVQNVGVFVEKYMYEYRTAGLKLHSWRRLERGSCWMCLILGLASAALRYYLYGMSEEVLWNGTAGAVAAVLLYLFQLMTDEDYQFEAARNYMVDYLENVCAHRCARNLSKEKKAAAAPENKEPEIQQPERPRPREEVPSPDFSPEIKPPVMPEQPEVAQPEIVGAQVQETRKVSAKKSVKKNPVRETTVQKEEPAASGEPKEPAPISKEVRIREILEEFLA